MKKKNLFKKTTKNLTAVLASLFLVTGLLAQSSFNLISPPNNSSLTVEGDATNQIVVSWDDDTLTSPTYNWVLLDATNDTVVLIPADNMGMDTTLTLTVGAIDGLFESLNVPQGTTLPLSWYVGSTDGTVLNTSDTFNITLTRGVVANAFDLVSPPTNTLLNVEGAGTNMIDITWNNSGNGVTYNWWLDVAGGDFSSPIILVPSNNMGMDTALTLDLATIDAVLAGAGVMLGDTANLQWAVSATAGADTIISTSVNTIDLVRGAIVSAFDLVSPPTNTLLAVEGAGSNTVDISWNNSGNGVTYNWWLDVAGGNFTNPIIVVPSNNMGMDTALTLDLATIDAVLAGAGVMLGDTANLQWAVSATAGADTIISTSVNTIDLVRGAIVSAFDLISPPNNTLLAVEGAGSNTVDISWNNAGNGVTYNWWLDVAGGNFTNPIIVVPSNNMGMDTALTLDLATIDAVLAGAGVNVGDTANLQWAVSATAGADTIISTSVNTIDLVRGSIANAFDLVSPPNNTLLVVEGAGSNMVDITWETSGNGVTYNWWLDAAGGNFTNPIIVVPSNNMGMDTALTLDFTTIDAVLAGAGVNVGDTANLQWAVSSTAGADTIISTSVFNIDLVRGTVLGAFGLVSPPDNTTLGVGGLGTQTVDISWNPSANGAAYTWLLDLSTGDFSNPIVGVPSNNMGMDTAVTLDFATIDAVLVGAGVAVGGSATLKWTAIATSGTDTVFASTPFNITLNRNGLAQPHNLYTPADGTTYTNQGNADQEINVTWGSAGSNATYTWVLSAGGTPIVAIPTGTDTSLILDFGTVEAVLFNNGIALNGTASLTWDVEANIGGTTTVGSANGPFSLGVVRGTVFFDFDLLTPPDGFSATIEGDPTQTVEVTWNLSSLGNVAYTWLLDVQGGDFSNPVVAVPSNNSGADTSLTLDFATINSVLTGAGVQPGSAIDLIWTVKVKGGGDSLLASAFDLNLTRGILTSTGELVVNNNFKVYPNPATDVLNISGNFEGAENIVLFDVTGKVRDVVINSKSGNNIEFNVNNLPDGLYLLSVTNNNNTTVKSFVISR